MIQVLSQEELRKVFDDLIPQAKEKLRGLEYDMLYINALIAEIELIFEKKLKTGTLIFDSELRFVSWVFLVLFWTHKKHWFLNLGQILNKDKPISEFNDELFCEIFPYDFSQRYDPDMVLIAQDDIRCLNAAYQALPGEIRARIDGEPLPGYANDPDVIRVRKCRAIKEAKSWFKEAGVKSIDDAIEYGAKIRRGLPVKHPASRLKRGKHCALAKKFGSS